MAVSRFGNRALPLAVAYMSGVFGDDGPPPPGAGGAMWPLGTSVVHASSTAKSVFTFVKHHRLVEDNRNKLPSYPRGDSLISPEHAGSGEIMRWTTMETDTTRLDPKRDVIKILVVDNIDLDGKGAAFEFLKEKGYTVHRGPMPSDITEPGVYVSYQPDITPAEIAKITTEDAYDGIITAAKNVSGPVTVGARMGAGVGNMQIDGIVTNTPGQNSAVTAERTIQAMLHARRDIGKEHEDVVRGTADSSDLSAYTAAGLGGQTLAVIGAGNIGQEVIKKALGMGMTVQVYNRSAPDWAAHFEGDPRVSFYASPKEAATGADVISVHTALTPETKGLVNTEVLSVMNPDALIVNYARGEVCDPDSVRKYLAANPGARLCVDADLFADTSRASPLEPFVEIAKAFPGQTVLTPHTAADTCPTTRVNCFKQGIAQTEAALFEGKVMNFAGNMVGKEFPAGYKDAGTKKPAVGYVGMEEVCTAMVANPLLLQAMREALQTAEKCASNPDSCDKVDATRFAERLAEVRKATGPERC